MIKMKNIYPGKILKRNLKMDSNMTNNYKDFHDSRQIFINDKRDEIFISR